MSLSRSPVSIIRSRTMQNLISRRGMVKLGLCGSALVPLLRFSVNLAEGAELPLLDASDPQAKALGFVTDASTVSAATNPTFKTGQKCAICAQFKASRAIQRRAAISSQATQFPQAVGARLGRRNLKDRDLALHLWKSVAHGLTQSE